MKKNISTLTDREEFFEQLGRLHKSPQDANFFLSSAWAMRYFVKWPQDDFFLGMRISPSANQSETDSAGMLCLSRGIRSSPLSRRHRSLGFNESSGVELAEVTTEINGLIGDSNIRFDEWIPAILGQLVAIEGWDELRVNALSTDDAASLVQAAGDLGLITHTFSYNEAYWVDLDQIQDRFAGDYLASRSANTRQQLRRALRSLQDKHGSFNLASASNLAQGHEWLDDLAVLHKKRWNASSETSGFENPHFGQFHHELMSSMLENGEVEILRACAGDDAFAYLYNFVINGKVYFSMSGVEYESFAPYKPGILAHWQAIEFYKARGMHIYDFQAGTSQYKQSLCTHKKALVTIVLRRPLLKFRLEAAARWVKRNVRRQVPAAAVGVTMK